MDSLKAFFDDHFAAFVQSEYGSDDDLNRAVAYALAGQGKRIRPLITLLSCESLGAPVNDALAAAIAVEMVHTYSLVHDDLPAMDNDSLRRGRATTHIVFGDALALLAGDGLLTDAFQVLLGDQNAAMTLERRAKQACELAMAAGVRGMVGGQAQDIHWTGRDGATSQILDSIHMGKTGALLGAAAAMGAIAGGGNGDVANAYRQFGQKIGLAFQILDDLLDGAVGTGKSQGKDASTNKLTYLRMMSHDEARMVASDLTSAAIAGIGRFGASERLVGFADKLLSRKF
jgi:geranylgeranyl pyrophosphate synthase